MPGIMLSFLPLRHGTGSEAGAYDKELDKDDSQTAEKRKCAISGQSH